MTAVWKGSKRESSDSFLLVTSLSTLLKGRAVHVCNYPIPVKCLKNVLGICTISYIVLGAGVQRMWRRATGQQDFSFSCSLLYPHCLAQCLPHIKGHLISKYKVNSVNVGESPKMTINSLVFYLLSGGFWFPFPWAWDGLSDLLEQYNEMELVVEDFWG